MIKEMKVIDLKKEKLILEGRINNLLSDFSRDNHEVIKSIKVKPYIEETIIMYDPKVSLDI